MLDTLDRIDRNIILALETDARASVSQIAERVGLSQSACTRRIQALESSGVITGYGPRYGWRVLGFHVIAYVEVTLASQAEAALEAFERGVSAIAGVVECALVSGGHDYHVKIICRDLDDYERIHREGLGPLPGVARINTSFALRQLKTRGAADALIGAPSLLA